MCLLDKSKVEFEYLQSFHGYKVFLIDRNGLIVSPFQLSKKIPFKFKETIEWIDCSATNNVGFYSFLNIKDAQSFENTEGAGYSISSGKFITFDVSLSKVTHFGMNSNYEACLISKRIYIRDFTKLRDFIHANRDNSYFKADVEKIASMTWWQYNEYVDSFKDYSYHAQN